jgi:hypothetical protein
MKTGEKIYSGILQRKTSSTGKWNDYVGKGRLYPSEADVIKGLRYNMYTGGGISWQIVMQEYTLGRHMRFVPPKNIIMFKPAQEGA